MRGRTHPLTNLLATGAGLLLAATMVGCAPQHDSGSEDTGTSSGSGAASLETGADIARRSSAEPGAASRSLPSARRAVAPLRFPAWPVLDRVSLVAADRPADASRDADLFGLLPTRSPWWTTPVWQPPPLPWS